MIQKDASYKRKIPPFKFDSRTGGNIPVMVNISARIKEVLSIHEVDMELEIKVILFMEWFDYRLEYHNLKITKSLNTLTLEDIKTIWIPYVVFENTKNSEGTAIDERTHISVYRDGEFSLNDDSQVEEIFIFPGSQNPITLEAIYTKKFSCNYNLSLYPFDTQVNS